MLGLFVESSLGENCKSFKMHNIQLLTIVVKKETNSHLLGPVKGNEIQQNLVILIIIEKG